eukprot:COSAG06_NODE_25347_length_639_cov_0.953704_2_plen_126_part_00
MNAVMKSMHGQTARPDIAACVTSGLFDMCLELVRAFEAGGVEGLQTVSSFSIYLALSAVAKCLTYPGCSRKVREVASALAFCLENNVDAAEEVGQTTSAVAALICASLCVCVPTYASVSTMYYGV